jgi:methionyl-tRNA formyltransferase
MLDLPRFGAINVHASLLPKYRGAAPIQWAVANGETTTGVTTMQMDSGLDTGDLLLQKSIPILPEDTAASLHDRLADLGAELLVETLRQMESSSLLRIKQDSSLASTAPLLKKEDGRLNWHWAAHQIHNHVRGFNPWPGTFTTLRGKMLKILKTKLLDGSSDPRCHSSEIAGAIIEVAHQPLAVATGDGNRLALLEVQPEGHRRMTDVDFVNGFRIRVGTTLGES